MSTNLSESMLRAELKKFICVEVLRKPDYPLAEDESLIEAALVDSYGLSRIVSYMEDTYQVSIDDEELTASNMDNLVLMSSFLMKRLNDTSQS